MYPVNCAENSDYKIFSNSIRWFRGVNNTVITYYIVFFSLCYCVSFLSERQVEITALADRLRDNSIVLLFHISVLFMLRR